MRFNTSVRNFFIAIGFIVLLIIIIFNAIIYLRGLGQRINLAVDSQLETAEAVAVLTNQFVGSLTSTLKLAGSGMNESPQLRNSSFLAFVKKTNPQFDSIAFRDTDGNLLFATQQEPTPPPTELIRAAVGDGEPKLSRLEQVGRLLGVRLIVPIPQNGATVNIMDAFITDRTFFDLVRIQVGTRGNVGLIDQSGTAITLTFDPDLPFSQRNRLFIPSVRQALEGRSATTRRFYDPVGDVYRMGASAPVSETGWAANVFRPYDEVVGPLQRQALIIAAISVMASLILIAIFLFLLRSLTRPINLMVGGTRAIYRGDYTHRLPTEFLLTELRQLSTAFNTMLDRLLGRLQTEKYIADTLQKSLLTPELPSIPGFKVSVFYASATEEALIGGDFFDVFEVGDDLWGMVIGDISGKGVEASLSTALTKFTIRDNAIKDSAPAAVLSAANNSLCHQFSGEEFVSAFYFLANAKTGEIRFGNAGHPYPIVCSEARKCCEQLKAPGLLLGVLENADYEERSTKLLNGEQLVLYTDGVIEARNAEGEMFGDKGLKRVCTYNKISAEQRSQLVYNKVVEFTGGSLSDDVAIMIVERTSPES